MRNMPSFIGDFPSKNKPKKSSSYSTELPIEKEANLREQRKKILQRLKKNVDPSGVTKATPSRNVPIDDLPEKIIFSPRTSKRFQKASQNGVKSSSGDEIKRLERDKAPFIVLQKAEDEGIGEQTVGRHRCTNKQHSSRAELPTELRNEDDNVSFYVPSFTEKPLRYLSKESPSFTKKKDKITESKIPTRKACELETLHNKIKNEPVDSGLQTRPKRAGLPLIVTEKDSMSLEDSVSDDHNDNEPYKAGSPFRRSASFHSLKERHQGDSRQTRTSAGKRRQFLKVDNDYHITKSASLSSLYDSPSLTVLEGYEGELSTSSTSFAKLQQQKLEEDFHRVEENLDRTFSELRKYLRTG